MLFHSIGQMGAVLAETVAQADREIVFETFFCPFFNGRKTDGFAWSDMGPLRMELFHPTCNWWRCPPIVRFLNMTLRPLINPFLSDSESPKKH